MLYYGSSRIFYEKGLTLAAKLAAGSTLKITRVSAGAGQTAQTASALSQIRQNLTVGAPVRKENTATLPVTLATGLAESAYTLRELGVYAQDPSEGEALYKLYRLSEPVDISPNSRLVLRFYLEETVSQDVNTVVACEVQGLGHQSIYLLNCDFNGNQKGTAIEVGNGMTARALNCTIKNYSHAALTEYDGFLVVSCENTEATSGNLCGARTYLGGIIQMGLYTDPMLGGTHFTKSGGLIVKPDNAVA